MASVLADSPPAPGPEAQAPPERPQGAPPETPPTPQPPAPALAAGSACAKCGVPLAEGQDWCLRCGTGATDRAAGSDWRSVSTILAATLVLVLGAAAAAYAALTKSAPVRRTMTATVAAAPPVTSPPATTPAPFGLGAATTPGVGSTLGTVQPPKIPLTASTPQTTSTPSNDGGAQFGEPVPAKKAKETTSTTQTGGAGSEPTPILLDTNAAKTYNPYKYPASDFGDPSLTIDGDTSTGWTATVNPQTAPRLAEGVLIDLNTPQKLSALELVTSSPGMTVQVYGTLVKEVPASITDPAWVPLSHQLVVKKHHTRIKLRHQTTGYLDALLWISQAGQKSIGTPTVPGHVTVDEVDLFPAG